MKYKITLVIAIFILAAIFFSGMQQALGSSSGAPPGYSGAPSDQQTCSGTGCHSGLATPISGWITSNIPAGGYTPGATYTISATATFNGFNKFGFEISPQDASGNVKGALVNTNTDTHILTGNKYITQTLAGTIGTNAKTWTFDWVAPSSGSGAVSFYGAFVCANGDNSITGDSVYYSALTVSEAPTTGVDAGIITITYPSVFACSSLFAPIVNLENFGTTTLTSVQINYNIDSNSPTTYTWTGTLGTFSSVAVTLPAIPLPPGTHTFTATTSNPNGGADAFTVNDIKSTMFSAVFSSQPMPFFEGFEGSAFPPAGWVRSNPDNATTWTTVSYASSSGNKCALMHNYGYPSHGQIDELITPEIDLTTEANPELTFQLAYKMYADSGSTDYDSDTLTIFISTDCGATWTTIYNKFDTALATSLPYASLLQFIPDSSDWRMESINLTPYATCNHAIFKFRNTTDYANELYIDDINISGPVGMNDVTNAAQLQIFPTPVNTLLSVNYYLEKNAPVTLRVYNLQGKEMVTRAMGNQQPGMQSEVIDVRNFPAGIYLLRITVGKEIISERFIVAR